MNRIQALRILDAATMPANAGKLTRLDYINCQAALECLASDNRRLAALDAQADQVASAKADAAIPAAPTVTP